MSDGRSLKGFCFLEMPQGPGQAVKCRLGQGDLGFSPGPCYFHHQTTNKHQKMDDFFIYIYIYNAEILQFLIQAFLYLSPQLLQTIKSRVGFYLKFLLQT